MRISTLTTQIHPTAASRAASDGFLRASNCVRARARRSYIIPPQSTVHFDLTFVAAADWTYTRGVAYGGVKRTVRLWVHNESEDCNEECLVFHVHFTYDRR